MISLCLYVLNRHLNAVKYKTVVFFYFVTDVYNYGFIFILLIDNETGFFFLDGFVLFCVVFNHQFCITLCVLTFFNWLWRTGFGVHRQKPAAMDERRGALLPGIRQFCEEGANIKLVRDRLYVNGNLYHHNSDQDEPSSQDGESVHPGR